MAAEGWLRQPILMFVVQDGSYKLVGSSTGESDVIHSAGGTYEQYRGAGDGTPRTPNTLITHALDYLSSRSVTDTNLHVDLSSRRFIQKVLARL